MLNYIAPQMSMWTKSPFSKGTAVQGPDPAEANTNQIQWNLLHTDSVT